RWSSERSIVRRRAQENSPETSASGLFVKSGDDLLSRFAHYHGPGVLNGRVRNGNGCGHPGVLTGKSLAIPTGGAKSCFSHGPAAARARAYVPQAPEGWINAAKRSAVSTGRLRPLLALHVRPIDLVVCEEPTSRRNGDLFWRGVSRLDAFSVYPG